MTALHSPAPDPYHLLPPVAALVVTSPDISDSSPLPLEHAHPSAAGSNLSPALTWEPGPRETRGYAVTCYDPDAPTGSGFWHWFLIGLPSTTTALPRGFSPGAPGARRGPCNEVLLLRNDFGEAAYTGAAPPPGTPAHRYLFAVHALDTHDLDLTALSTCAYGGYMLTLHTIARGVLRPTFERT